MSDNKTEATIAETGESLYSVEINVSGHKIIGDEPVSFGSKNLGPAPYDLLLASLGECTAMTIRWFANQQAWPLDHVQVSVTHEKQGKQDVFTKQIIIKGNGLSDEQRQKLHDVGAKCPVHKTLASDVIINTVDS